MSASSEFATQNCRWANLLGYAATLRIIAYVAAVTVPFPSVAQQAAETFYSDPHGFFRMVPPAGWRVQQYRDDPRGKAAFIRSESTSLRILAKSVEFSSFEDLQAEIQAGTDRLRSRFGADVQLDTVRFIGHRAIMRTFTIQGSRCLGYNFLVGNVCHDLQYIAPVAEFDRYQPIVNRSMETYEPIARDDSPAEIRRHSVAQKLRLAQLFMGFGNRSLALEYVKEGLSMEPENARLLELKRELQTR